jgi:hypothetical protein
VGELADTWSEHTAESQITDIAVDALGGRPVIPKDLNAFGTLIASEVAVIHQQIVTMRQAIDVLKEAGKS